MADPLLSAAMIVRDESRHLATCLASIQAIVDDVVIIDTGSLDSTIDIALRHGARVVSQPWRDDFSFHRNASLREVRGAWAFVIDGDEEVRDPGNLRALVEGAAPEVDAFSVVVRPDNGRAGYEAIRVLRVGRCDYEYPVHNQVRGAKTYLVGPDQEEAACV